MQLKGQLKEIFPEKIISEKFTKRDFVITDASGKYPQHISFQLTQDNCSELDKFSVGDWVNVEFVLRGREWTSPKGEKKYFNTLEAYNIMEYVSDMTAENNPAAYYAPKAITPNTEADESGLPF